MNFSISNEAAEFYKNELNLTKGDQLRFYIRYGGFNSLQKGFSLGIMPDTPSKIGAAVEVDGITFFIEEDDLWYFDEHNFQITFNQQNEELEFNYH